MHPRSPYQSAPNFAFLAREYPDLHPYLTGNTLDFQDDAAQRALTRALLHRDFNLTIDLPSNRLCPPVPNRLNYVLWIQDIVRAHEEVLTSFVGEEDGINVRGFDVGTGASAIYPLLACSLEPDWSFIATELDAESYTYACANIRKNGFGDRVRVIKVNHEETMSSCANLELTTENKSSVHTMDYADRNGGEDVEMRLGNTEGAVGDDKAPVSFGFEQLFKQHDEGEDGQQNDCQRKETSHNMDTELPRRRNSKLRIEFTMCNPPFYRSAAEVEEGLTNKEAGPLSVCTGAPVEMITPGGEAQFVIQMIKESAGGGTFIPSQTPDHLRNVRNEQPPSPVKSGGKRPLEKSGPKERAGKRRRVITSDSGGGGEKMLRLRWYTSMLGKMGSVVEVVDELGALGISNYAVTEFVQGQTRRWAVGWSVGGFRLPDNIARIQNPNPTLQRLMPQRNTLQFSVLNLQSTRIPRDGQLTELELLSDILSSIDGVRIRAWKPTYGNNNGIQGNNLPDSGSSSPYSSSCLLVRAAGDTWSRSARRKRKTQAPSESESGRATPELMSNPNPNTVYRSTHINTSTSTPTPTFSPASTTAPATNTDLLGDIASAALVCCISWTPGDVSDEGSVDVRWVYGFDRALFESFASHVVSRLRAARRGAV